MAIETVHLVQSYIAGKGKALKAEPVVICKSAEEYLGLGVGAASFWRDPAGGGARWHNHRKLDAYRDPARRLAEHTTFDAAELARDLLWLGMRTSDGVARAAVPADAAAWALAHGLVEDDGARR